MKMIMLSLVVLIASIASALGESCGKPNFPMAGNQRIVGGREANQYSHPWIVSLQKMGRHKCGGTLIRVSDKNETDIVVTAAHCFLNGVSGWSVTAGAHNLDKKDAHVRRETAKIVPNAEFNKRTGANDIAIIKLSAPIKFDQTIQPICLPNKGEFIADHTFGIVAGWGYLKEKAFDTSKKLMQVSLPVASAETCKEAYGKTSFKITRDEMMCAGGAGGQDACQGDSGGPFVFRRSGAQVYVLEGVVSFGTGCARPGVPGVFARVSNYIDWIQGQVKALSDVANNVSNVSV